MGLHIENKGDLPFACLNCLRFGGFDIQHVKEFAKHLVHGQKSQGHPSGGFQEFPTVDPELTA